MQEIINPIVETTAATLEKSLVVAEFNSYINKAEKSWKQYNKLKDESKNLQIIQNHINKITSASASTQINQAYKNQKNNRDLVNWLNDLKKWSLNAYSIIMDFRSFITKGQAFVYHVMSKTKKGTFSYQINEDHFIKLLSGADLKVKRGDWDNLSGGDLASILQLSVEDPQRAKIRLSKNKGESKINLKKDALYNYLEQHNEALKLMPNRRYELYSQLKTRREWITSKRKDWIVYNKNGEYFFTKTRELDVDEFISKYVHSKELAQDNIRFYKTGDSIIDNEDGTHTSVENKIGGSAGVSISTIKNGIRNIIKLKRAKTGKGLITQLKNMFVQYGTEDIAKAIYDGAAEETESAIKDVVNELVNVGYIKKK